MKTNYLPHLNITVIQCLCPSAKGTDTQVNTLFVAQVQLMAQSQYSTYLSLFLYLWGLIYYAPSGGLQSAGREALFGYDVL